MQAFFVARPRILATSFSTPRKICLWKNVSDCSTAYLLLHSADWRTNIPNFSLHGYASHTVMETLTDAPAFFPPRDLYFFIYAINVYMRLYIFATRSRRRIQCRSHLSDVAKDCGSIQNKHGCLLEKFVFPHSRNLTQLHGEKQTRGRKKYNENKSEKYMEKCVIFIFFYFSSNSPSFTLYITKRLYVSSHVA